MLEFILIALAAYIAFRVVMFLTNMTFYIGYYSCLRNMGRSHQSAVDKFKEDKELRGVKIVRSSMN